MPFYDYKCDLCGQEAKDILAKMDERQLPCTKCADGIMERMWKLGAAHGDEIDIWVENALCNADGTPKHYRSKEQLKRDAAEKGWTNAVTHIGAQGSDKSKFTVNWATGLPPGVDGRLFCQLTSEEQEARHKEWESS